MVMKVNESQTELQVDDYSVTSVRLDLVAFWNDSNSQSICSKYSDFCANLSPVSCHFRSVMAKTS